MRYELDVDGFIYKVFFGCGSGYCTAYTGSVPSGYSSLEQWADTANIRAYYLVNGNLTFSEARDYELKYLWSVEEENSKISNYIYQEGANSNGRWIKYVDGTMVTIQRYNVHFSEPTEWGSMYAYSIWNIMNYPQTFVELPTVSVTLSANDVNGWLCTNVETGVESTSRPCGYQLVRPTKKTLGATYIHVVAWGRWK